MGKDKLRRFAEMETFSNVVQPSLQEVLNRDYKLKGNWRSGIFKNDHPIILELGCGKGEYTVGLAKSYIDQNFIGIDIKGARMWRGAKEALQENLQNAFFLRTRIEFISSFFAENEVNEIWITFPDPQLKDSRVRKRLTHPLFLNRYKSFLHPSGTVNLKTDSRELYDYTLEVIDELKLEVLESSHDLYHPDTAFSNVTRMEQLLSIRTFYERKFLEEGKQICYLKFRLNGDHKIK